MTRKVSKRGPKTDDMLVQELSTYEYFDNDDPRRTKRLRDETRRQNRAKKREKYSF
jgi:hypothetical protein